MENIWLATEDMVNNVDWGKVNIHCNVLSFESKQACIQNLSTFKVPFKGFLGSLSQIIY